MTRSVLIVPLLACVLPSMNVEAMKAEAKSRSHVLAAPNPSVGEITDHVAPGTQLSGTREDTLWFGGDDGQGVAVPGGAWAFETPGSNGFQGWTSRDMTENPGVYFGRVTEADVLAPGDPCVPIEPGNTGMLWCGIHEDEANRRDFQTGMG
jgi:hypothetical protein